MIPASWFLILSAVLFLIGVLGFFLKRNIIALLLRGTAPWLSTRMMSMRKLAELYRDYAIKITY